MFIFILYSISSVGLCYKSLRDKKNPFLQNNFFLCVLYGTCKPETTSNSINSILLWLVFLQAIPFCLCGFCSTSEEIVLLDFYTRLSRLCYLTYHHTLADLRVLYEREKKKKEENARVRYGKIVLVILDFTNKSNQFIESFWRFI